MKNKAGRIYVGKVLDILKKVDKRYASLAVSEDGKGVTHLSLTVYLEVGVSYAMFLAMYNIADCAELEGRRP